MTRFPFVLAFVMVAATTFFGGAPTAQAADVICSGTLGGGSTVTDITGNVTVPEKASCTLDFVTVAGNVHVGKGASLVVTAYTEPSTISGNVEAVNCGSVLLQGNVTVEGNLHIQSCSGGPNGFQVPVECGALPGLARQGRGQPPYSIQSFEDRLRRQPRERRWKSSLPAKLAGPDPGARAKLGGRQFAGSMRRLCDDDVFDRHAC